MGLLLTVDRKRAVGLSYRSFFAYALKSESSALIVPLRYSRFGVLSSSRISLTRPHLISFCQRFRMSESLLNPLIGFPLLSQAQYFVPPFIPLRTRIIVISFFIASSLSPCITRQGAGDFFGLIPYREMHTLK